MTRHALIAMSAKPYHAGHDQLIRTASAENDDVTVFVSLSDRKRKGELPISGAAMGTIWRRFIEPSMPGNVTIEYGGVPVRKVYELLEAESDAGSEDTYTIYSDPVDLAARFPMGSLEKYAGDLYNRGRIVLEPVMRSSTVDVSGTQMRQWIASGDKESFIAHLPEPLRAHGVEVWTLLAPTV